MDLQKICDQKQDCSSDDEDEDPVYCRGLNICSSGEFECGAYGNCINKNQLCNGKEDCEKGEDEDPNGVCAGKIPVPTKRGCGPIYQTEVGNSSV